MSKRRRTSSIASSKDCDGSLDGNGESGHSVSIRKRRKKQDPMELVQQVYDSIRNQRKEDGTLLCDAFIRIPKRRQAPLYYELVQHPLDLLRVQQKLKTDEYSDIKDLQADIELIVSNTKSFHRKTSPEYRDACDLLHLFYLNKAKIIDGVKSCSPSSATKIRGNRQQGYNTGRRSSLSILPQLRGKLGSTARKSLPTRAALTSNYTNHYHQHNNNRRNSYKHRLQLQDDDDDDDDDDDEKEEDDDDDDAGEELTTAKHNTRRQRLQQRPLRCLVPPDSGGEDTTTTSHSSTTAGEDSSVPTSYNNAFEELFSAIMTATDADNQPLHTDFQLLPSRRKYPKYYEFIDSPIDLRMIATKIQSHSYHSLNEIERDIQTLTRNACVFNEPGSHIYRCAKMLRRVAHQKRIEMEHNGCWKQTETTLAESKSERIRNRRLRGNAGMSLSAITAALKDDSEEESVEEDDSDSEDADEEGDDDEEKKTSDDSQAECDSAAPDYDSDANTNTTSTQLDNPKWKLFEAVRSMQSPSGTVLSEPFWRLPSRRFYPDYYREIKNPVSLTQIRRKLTSHSYGTVSEVAGDLTVLFENAKRYNQNNSKLYKDAVKLQKIMQLKLQELLDIDQDFDTDIEQEYKSKRGPKPKNYHNTTVQGAAPRGRPPKERDRLGQDNSKGSAWDTHVVPLKKRLHIIAKFLLDYKKADGRQPLLAFVEKPSKKLYPDYYEVISEPIDFLDIEARIKSDRYSTERDMIHDFQLMFSNCRTYNETNSPLFEDACLLEKVLLERTTQSNSGTVNNTLPSATTGNSSPLYKFNQHINRVCKGRRVLSPNARRCKLLYDTIREYREPKASRQLSTIFLKLPSKSDYPDYYEVIEKPIDLERIGHKAKTGKYHEVDDVAADLVLMFDNACKFNEPDSQVYKDALVLHQLTLQQKRKLKQGELGADGIDSVPDVQAAVQDLLLDLFTSVYNHQDEDERCYTDSLAELPEHDACPDNPGKRLRGLSLDLIKRRLDGSLYQRLDSFQMDMFACLERARHLSHTESQVFEDAVELQRFFIQRRNELCKEGQVLRSPALRYTLQLLEEEVDLLCKEKRKTEEVEVETEENQQPTSEFQNLTGDQHVMTNGPVIDDNLSLDESGNENKKQTESNRTYKVGDFVYLDSSAASTVTITSSTPLKRQPHNMNHHKHHLHNNTTANNSSAAASFQDKETEPHIVLVERLFTGSGGRQMMYGSNYLRPAETYHLSTRRFLEHEVFKGDTHVTAPLAEIVGRCCVLSVKVYFTQRPTGFRDEDVYVLESRYSSRMRSFKKIKIFRDLNHLNVKLVVRETPVEPKRVMSVFRERLEKHKDELQELQDCLEQSRDSNSKLSMPNVPLELVLDSDGMGNSDGKTNYEQYNYSGATFKTGDFVYVMTDGGRQMIAQIDTIWIAKDGKEFFRGPWFVSPSEVPPSPTRLFYKQEVLLSTVEDTNPLVSILAKCSVLHYNEFIASRVTEVSEADVYICTSMLDEVNRQVKRLTPEGLRKVLHHSPHVAEDEVYFFPRLLNPPKYGIRTCKLFAEIIAFRYVLRKDMDIIMEDSLDASCGSSLGFGDPHSDAVTQVVVAMTQQIQPSAAIVTLTNSSSIINIGVSATTTQAANISTITTNTPTPVKKKVNKTKLVTGYILYSRDVRKTVCQTNPESNFGEISKIVGNDWRGLPTGIKQSWEERAVRMNEESRERDRQLQQSEDGGNSPAPVLPPPDQVFECLWDKCDFQFEELSDCVEHCIRDRETGGGHVQSFYAQRPDTDLNCMWRGCGRHNKKNVQPFPNMQRLTRHVRDMHINKGNGRSIAPDARNKNFKPSSKVSSAGAVMGHLQQTNSNSGPTAVTTSQQHPSTSIASSLLSATAPASCTAGVGGSTAGTKVQAQQFEPMFITVPPRPQRVLHSEAYIKYIEGLHAENKFISPWERTLTATQQSVQLEQQQSALTADLGQSAGEIKLQQVVAWLGPHQQQQEHVVSALWTLRNQLLKDALGLQKTL